MAQTAPEFTHCLDFFLSAIFTFILASFSGIVAFWLFAKGNPVYSLSGPSFKRNTWFFCWFYWCLMFSMCDSSSPSFLIPSFDVFFISLFFYSVLVKRDDNTGGYTMTTKCNVEIWNRCFRWFLGVLYVLYIYDLRITWLLCNPSHTLAIR